MNFLRNPERLPWVLPNLHSTEMEFIHKPNNVKGTLHFSFRLVLHLLIILLANHQYADKKFLVVAALVLINGALWNFSGWAGLGHELFHKSVFSITAVNIYLCKLLAILNWNNYYYFYHSHTLHHKNTMYDNDPEAPLPKGIKKQELISLILLSPSYIYRRIRITFLNAIGVVPGEFGKFLYRNANKIRNIKRFASYILLFQFALMILFLISGKFILFFMVTLAPFISKLPNRILEIVQHYKMQTNVNDFRLNTRSVEINKFIKLLYANMNYHLEHHIFPNLPYYNMHLARGLLLEKKFIEEIKINGFRQILKIIYEK